MQYFLDCVEEAEDLVQEVRYPLPPRAPEPVLRERRQAMQRLAKLHLILEREPPAHDPTLEADLAASKAGEVPSFLRERMQQQKEAQEHG